MFPRAVSFYLQECHHNHNSRRLWSVRVVVFVCQVWVTCLVSLCGRAAHIKGLQKNGCAPRFCLCCGQRAGRSESPVCLVVRLSGKRMCLCSVWALKIWANKFTASVSSIIEIFTYGFVSKWQMVWHFGMSFNDVFFFDVVWTRQMKLKVCFTRKKWHTFKVSYLFACRFAVRHWKWL